MSKTYVLTPGGYKPRGQVHHLPEGHVFKVRNGRAEVHHPEFGLRSILGAQPMVESEVPLLPRSVQALPPDPLAPFRAVPEDLDLEAFPQVNGWVSYADWSAPAASPISYFETTWAVPPEPLSKETQTIFLFNGIQSSSMILQPVLQWGPSAAGGGPHWSIASWYADSQSGHSIYSSLVDVEVGMQLTGIMQLTGQSAAGCDYVCEFAGMPQTRLSVSGQPVLTWANETLECYGISRRAHLPNAAGTDFDAVRMRCADNPAPVVWEVRSDHPESGSHASILDGSPDHGQVRVTYG